MFIHKIKFYCLRWFLIKEAKYYLERSDRKLSVIHIHTRMKKGYLEMTGNGERIKGLFGGGGLLSLF